MVQVGPDWQQVIDKVSRGRYVPLLLVYAERDDMAAVQCQEPLTRISVKGHEPSNTGRGPSKFTAYGRGMPKILV